MSQFSFMNNAMRHVAASLMTAGLAVAPTLMGGCEKPMQQQAPPTPEVTVAHPIEHEVIEWDEYAGNLAATDTVNLSARVSGFVTKADFEEGALVHTGDLLYVIDERPFQADLDSKLAAVAQAQAVADNAKLHYDRYAKVLKTQSISQDDYDAAKAAYEQGNAALGVAKASVAISRLNLDWTHVVAPITGRISRKYVTVGNLVNGGAGQATQLTTIVSTDPLYCYVNIPGRAFLDYQALARLEKSQNLRGGKVPCFLALENETGFPHEGVIDFLDNQVDPTTGTLQIRGIFKNGEGLLTPGLYGRLRIPGSGRYKALLIPDQAVGTDQAERFVLLAGEHDIVERRRVTLGKVFGELRSIPEGLTLKDRVIVNGMVRAFPGRPVKPVEEAFFTASLDTTAPGSPTTQQLPTTLPSAAPSTAPTTPQ